MPQIETVAAFTPAVAVDPTCANCGAVLLGPFCHICGQHRREHHRSVRHLAAELAADLSSADGRVWRTLRRLVADPGRLTRDYIAGRRACELPPLRFYAAAVILMFAAGSILAAVEPDRAPKFNNGLRDPSFDLNQMRTGRTAWDRWIISHAEAARAHPDAFQSDFAANAERLPLAMLPLTALILWLLYANERRWALYDHLVFSLHTLTGAALLIAVVLLLSAVPTGGELAPALLLALPVQLWRHMRGTFNGRLWPACVRFASLAALWGVALMMVLAAFGMLELALA